MCLDAVLSPYPAQAGGNIGCGTCLSWSVRSLYPLVPTMTVERGHNAVRDEPAARRIEVPISELGLLICIKPLRHDQVELVFRPGHRHIQQPPFFFDLLGRSCGHVRWNAAVSRTECCGGRARFRAGHCGSSVARLKTALSSRQ